MAPLGVPSSIALFIIDRVAAARKLSPERPPPIITATFIAPCPGVLLLAVEALLLLVLGSNPLIRGDASADLLARLGVGLHRFMGRG
jgi:hypothetical protein